MAYGDTHDVQWKNAKILKTDDLPHPEGTWRYEVILPDFLADWDVLASWEAERTVSMEKNLKKGDILYDVGTEKAWQSAVYAQFVGGAQNMVLIEPSKVYWPNIKQIFENNKLGMPRACWVGLVGNEIEGNIKGLTINEWPDISNGELYDGLTYEYIHEHSKHTSQLTIDELVLLTGAIPDAITCDIEGAEIVMVKGAEQTLKKYHPKVWLSLHDEIAIRDGYGDVQNVHDFMKEMGYPQGLHLATDHESHWYWHYGLG